MNELPRDNLNLPVEEPFAGPRSYWNDFVAYPALLGRRESERSVVLQ